MTAVGGGCLLLALATGYAALAFIGATLMILVGVGFVWTFRSFSVTAARTLSQSSVSRGEPVEATLVVTNTGTRTRGRLTATEHVGPNEVSVAVPRLRPGAAHSLTYNVPTAKRGLMSIGPVQCHVADPYVLFTRSAQLAGEALVYVRPATQPVRLPVHGRIRALDAGEADKAIEGSLTFHALREYVPGDDRRRIHWRTSARMGTLMVKQHIDMTLPQMVIALDLRGTGSDEFEELMDFVTSVGVAALQKGNPVRTLTSNGSDETFVGQGSAMSFLDAMAVIDADGADEDDTWLRKTLGHNSGSTALIAAQDADVAAEMGRLVGDGKFGTVVAAGVSPQTVVATDRSVVVISAPMCRDLCAAWESMVAR